MKLTPRTLVQRPRIFLLVLLVLAKSALVLALTDSFFYGEELEKGAAAKAMIDGLGVPHHQLAYHYYEGGGFVISHLKALAFLAVGQNLLAHKIVATAFNVAILLVGYAFTRRSFGERAALWFGVLFILGPESYQKLSLISLGIHFEACLFLFGVLGLGARIAFGTGARPVHWLSLGLVTGFGLYFSYQIGLAAAWVLLMLLCFRRRELFGRGALFGLAGTLVGAVPLGVMYSLVGDAIFDIHGTSVFASGDLAVNLGLFREFLSSIFLEGTLGDRVGPFLWLGGALLALGALLFSRDEEPRSVRRSTLYLAGYLGLFLLAYLKGPFVQGRVEYYFFLLRLAPLWIFGTVLLAAGLGQLPRRRALATTLGTLFVIVGLRATWFVLETGQPTTLARNWTTLVQTKGYSFDQYFAKVLPHFAGGVAEKLELVEGFDEEERNLLRADAALNLFEDPTPDLVTAYGRAMEIIRTRGAESESDYVLGLGALFVRGSQWSQEQAIASVGAAAPETHAGLLEALGRFGGGRHPLLDLVHAEVERGLRLDEPVPYLRGVGRWLYRRFRIDAGAAARFIAEQPPEASGPLAEGYESERRWHTLGD